MMKSKNWRDFLILLEYFSKHRRITESMKLSNELYKTVLKTTNDAIWILIW